MTATKGKRRREIRGEAGPLSRARKMMQKKN